MSPASFWDQDRLASERLPTLQELVRCCDEKLLTRVVVDEHAARMEGSAPPPKRRRAMEKRFTKTLSCMRSLPIKKKAGRSLLLVPEESFVLHADTGLLERRLWASLVSLDDVRRTARLGAARADILKERCDRTPGIGVPPAFGGKGLSRRGYALAPWELTLASRVWLGGSWCRRERYLVIASALWEMTYFGFEYDRVVARQAQARGERLVGGERPSAGAADAPPGVSSTARARSFDLKEPDRFEADFLDRLAVRVSEFNEAADVDFRMRCIDLVRRMEEP